MTVVVVAMPVVVGATTGVVGVVGGVVAAAVLVMVGVRVAGLRQPSHRVRAAPATGPRQPSHRVRAAPATGPIAGAPQRSVGWRRRTR